MAFRLSFDPEGQSVLRAAGNNGTHDWEVRRSSDGSISFSVGTNYVVLDDEQSAALKMILNGGK